MQVMKDRRSIRRYKKQDVEREKIEEVLYAASLAPSAKNRQPWKYLVYTKKAKEMLCNVMEQGLLREQNGTPVLPQSAFGLPDAFHTLQIMRQAPVVILILNTNGTSPYEPVDSDRRVSEICDSLAIGASVQNMLLKATELGLGTLWIANTCFAYPELVKFLNTEQQLAGAVALGYAAESPYPRDRRSVQEIAEFRE